MNAVERYEKILKAALKVRQLRYEIREELDVIADNITAKELRAREFNSEDAKKAFKLLEGVKIEEATYCGSKATYKDIDVLLHSPIGDAGVKAMQEILTTIGNKQIINNWTVKFTITPKPLEKRTNKTDGSILELTETKLQNLKHGAS